MFEWEFMFSFHEESTAFITPKVMFVVIRSKSNLPGPGPTVNIRIKPQIGDIVHCWRSFYGGIRDASRFRTRTVPSPTDLWGRSGSGLGFPIPGWPAPLMAFFHHLLLSGWINEQRWENQLTYFLREEILNDKKRNRKERGGGFLASIRARASMVANSARILGWRKGYVNSLSDASPLPLPRQCVFRREQQVWIESSWGQWKSFNPQTLTYRTYLGAKIRVSFKHFILQFLN